MHTPVVAASYSMLYTYLELGTRDGSRLLSSVFSFETLAIYSYLLLSIFFNILN